MIETWIIIQTDADGNETILASIRAEDAAERAASRLLKLQEEGLNVRAELYLGDKQTNHY